MASGARRIRVTVTIDESVFDLADPEGLADLRRRIEKAVRRGGGFVDLFLVGDREASVLITGHTRVTIAKAEETLEPEDELLYPPTSLQWDGL